MKELVLVAPVQGSEALRVELAVRVESSVRVALRARGFVVTVSQAHLGKALVACQTPECIGDVLQAAGVAFAIVPAIWSRETGGEELAVTLMQRSTRNLNAAGIVESDLPSTSAALIDELLAERAAAASLASAAAEGPVSAPAHPHAWKAGPIILITAGAGAFIAIGVAAGIKSDTQQLNTGAVAAWSAVGAAAIGGGIAWWVIGAQRRRENPQSAATPAPAIGFSPTGIDLRLRF